MNEGHRDERAGMLIAWSGHRPDVFRDPRAAEATVTRLVSEKAAAGVEVICGGQRGVDHWAVRAAIDVRISFHLVLPSEVPRFARDWSPHDRVALEGFAARATSIAVIDPAEELGPLAYDLRNEAIVRRADALVVVRTSVRRGGTFQTVSAARAKGIPVEELVLEGVGGRELGIWERGL